MTLFKIISIFLYHLFFEWYINRVYINKKGGVKEKLRVFIMEVPIKNIVASQFSN